MARKRKPEEQKQGVAEWMATYGDLVTLLMCFFVLLFAMSSLDEAKFDALASSFGGNLSLSDSQKESILELLGNGLLNMPSMEAQGPSNEVVEDIPEESVEENERYMKAQNELSEIISSFEMYLTDEQVSAAIEVTKADYYVLLKMSNDLLFDSGSAEIKPNAVSLLDIVGEIINSYPENDIRIEGHADNMPIHTIQYKNNWYLSGARAIEVGTYFTDRMSIASTRIETVCYGENRPIASNDTAEGRSLNRRVEIKILSKYYSNNFQ